MNTVLFILSAFASPLNRQGLCYQDPGKEHFFTSQYHVLIFRQESGLIFPNPLPRLSFKVKSEQIISSISWTCYSEIFPARSKSTICNLGQ